MKLQKMDKNEIINRISFIRTRACLSQKALSIAIDMNVGYINRLESKRNFLPSMEVFLRIIEECGSCLPEFFYYSIEAFEEDKKLIDTLKDLKDNDKKAAILTLLK